IYLRPRNGLVRSEAIKIQRQVIARDDRDQFEQLGGRRGARTDAGGRRCSRDGGTVVLAVVGGHGKHKQGSGEQRQGTTHGMTPRAWFSCERAASSATRWRAPKRSASSAAARTRSSDVRSVSPSENERSARRRLSAVAACRALAIRSCRSTASSSAR